ncbi:MAG: Uma2 family endonuclease [Candidatus Schekmanbacteria bacterium]|nr:Uma2 family endonuclease [Candidatus Schekmanbacteria bacterium]
MSESARRKATYEDLLGLPPDVVGEIIDGELSVLPRPAPLHASTASVLTGDLRPFSRTGGGGGSGRWRILAEPEIHLEGDIVVPDLAGWRRERMPLLPPTAFFTLPPDWICEVLSPSTVRVDRTKKKRIYARHRVEFLWLVDPWAQTLEVLRLVGDFWQEIAVHGGDERVRAMPFEAIELDLGQWWEEVEPGGMSDDCYPKGRPHE